MNYFSIIKHLLIRILIILCLCTMPLNLNIDIGVLSNIKFQHLCFGIYIFFLISTSDIILLLFGHFRIEKG